MVGADIVTPSSSLPAYASGRPPDPLHIRKKTPKSKFLLSQAFKWEKNMFFVIPEMQSKTCVMGLKKLPDHFKILWIKVIRPSRKKIPDPNPKLKKVLFRIRSITQLYYYI